MAIENNGIRLGFGRAAPSDNLSPFHPVHALKSLKSIGMSKKASDKRTYSPSSALPHLASKDANSSQGPDWGLEMNDAVYDKRLAKLVERMKTAKSAMHEPLLLGNEGNQTNHFPNDGGPAKSRSNVWDTVRRCGTAIVAQTVNFDGWSSLRFFTDRTWRCSG